MGSSCPTVSSCKGNVNSNLLNSNQILLNSNKLLLLLFLLFEGNHVILKFHI